MTKRVGPAPLPLLDLPDHQRAYLAGLIDGEGYIGITVARGSKSAMSTLGGESYRLNLAVRMTDRRPLDEVSRWTGYGSVRSKNAAKGRRQPFEWNVWSRQAAAILVAIRPFLLVKSEQADLALEFQRIMRQPGNAGLRSDEWDARRRLAAAVKSFNYGRKAS